MLCLGTDKINQVAVEYTYADEKMTLEGLYYSSPGIMAASILLFCGMICLIVFFRMQAANAVKQSKQEKALARFMGYVCAANEEVMEVNLEKRKARSFSLDEENHVMIKTFPYHSVHYNNYNDAIYPEDYEKLLQNISEESLDKMIDHEGGERYFECRAKGKNGEYQWYSYSIQAIPKDKEHPRNFILFKKNIDEAKKEEEAQKQTLRDALATAKEASEAKGNFLSRISHEIRTPLNAVIGYISIARQPDSDASKIEHCLVNSEAASKHLLSVLNNVLDMSSIESGKMKLAKEKFDLLSLMESLSVMFYEQTAKKGIKFAIEVKNFEHGWVIGDKLRVNQILINLLSNAVKFTEEDGQVTLRMTQMENTQEKCCVKFEVTDSGIGMSEEYRTRLFKPFEQESAKTAQKFGGTGLGLSIAWNLATMMGGSIDVKSTQNVGTTFIVLLTFEPCDNENAKIENHRDFSKIRVLIVDDEKNECEYEKAVLKQFGMKCDFVTSGEKAVQRIKSRQGSDYAYKLCIMDWSMPEQNGIEAARKMREECGSDIPIVITTAYDISEIQQQAEEAGVSKVISKPLFQSTLFNLLLEIFGKYEPEEKMDTSQIDFKGTRILLAEDNEMNLEIAIDVLTRSGLVVDTASNGKEACERFENSEEGTYQAILMDVQMPIMDGYEATRKIRDSKHPQAETIPIIATSANAFSEDVAASMACGMNGHISKPIDYTKLYKALMKAMNDSKK